MKKITAALLTAMLATASVGAAAQSYSDYYSAGRQYENREQFVHALGSYWKAMESEPTSAAKDAGTAYKELSEAIRNGFPGNDLYGEKGLYEGWLRLCREYEQFWCSTLPYVIDFDSLDRFVIETPPAPKGKDSEQKAQGPVYSFTLHYFAEPSYEKAAIEKIVTDGYKKVRRNYWAGLYTTWPKFSAYSNRREAEADGVYAGAEYYLKFAIKNSAGKTVHESLYTSVENNTYSWQGEDFDPAGATVELEEFALVQNGSVVAAFPGSDVLCFDFDHSTDEFYRNIPGAFEALACIEEQMVSIEGGSFDMGNDEGTKDEGPVHQVTVGSFELSKFEVTKELYATVLNRDVEKNQGDRKPYDKATWYDAVDFCNKLSELKGLTPCYSGSGENIQCDFSADGFRLPTEAEWEYAARGGADSHGFRYSGSDNLDEVAWYEMNSSKGPHEVGTKKPNSLGLYDMSGNVSEWCWDWYRRDYYQEGGSSNPTGPERGRQRIMRGGYYGSKFECSVSDRSSTEPAQTVWYSGYIGIRLCRTKK